ncbi:hypothetical protein [Halalkalibacter alkalisediminis]|uniref:Uncharacterized protein n=1 Tax=Halalkalibacter alkalisediminis TaxID=935616 RepID=A0ABV6NNF0_9BACI|nr:hypothetical protein [Halalkalibacter alkalisediminis]
MIVNELIETKEIYAGEVADNYYVIYEETLCKDFVFKNNYLFEKSSLIEKAIHIFKGDSCSSLQKVKAYPINHVALESMKEIIGKEHPEIFNKG